jgi:NAD(P)-dependent dehydrogenase (short-subunit alcohol dehydrogenase family)
MAAKADSPFSLTGQRILITGAAGGIGGATARLCLRQGAQVVLADRQSPDHIARQVETAVSSSDCHQLDTSRRAEVEALAARIGPIDGLVDTAAICPEDDWMSEDWDEALQRVFEVNIRGPINLARAFMPGMAARKQGRIVLCGSVAGWMGGIVSGPHYAFTKGGIHAFTRWLARRGAPDNVLVNAIAPGPVATAMTAGKDYRTENYPLRRMAEPEEIAAMAAFLLGPGAGYVAGAVMDVNGAVHYR